MTRAGRIALKAAAWAACLAPLGWLAWQLSPPDPAIANPIDFATDTLGDWTLRILLASLSMTPLRILFGWSWPITLRRLVFSISIRVNLPAGVSRSMDAGRSNSTIPICKTMHRTLSWMMT